MTRTEFADTVSVVPNALPDDPDSALPELPSDIENQIHLQAWWCLLQPWKAPEMSKGGIVLAQQTQDITEYNQFIAKLILHGPKAFTSPKLVDQHNTGHVPKPGDWVLLNRTMGQEYERANDYGERVRFRICPDDAIMAVLPSPKGWAVGGVL